MPETDSTQVVWRTLNPTVSEVTEEAHVLQLGRRSEIAITDMQILCNIFFQSFPCN